MNARPTFHTRQGGFIITLELIMILSLLGIGLFVGIVAIRDALVKYQVNQQARDVYVSDSVGTVLGKAVGFDEHEAPQVFYIDRSGSQTHRALIGIRDDRFTTREPVYYTQLNCKGDPCLKAPSTELYDNRGVDGIPGSGAVSYMYAMQGGPTYAVGRSPDGIPGHLYKHEAQYCEVDVVNAALGSRYISQKVEMGEPCESPFNLPLPVGEAPRVCSGSATALTCPQVGPNACGAVDGSCSCPVGYYDAGNQLGLVDGQCCPNGTQAKQDGLTRGAICEDGGLLKAVAVTDPDDPDKNALERFEPPFQINLPPEAGNADDWVYIPPDGESGEAELNRQ